MRWFDEHIHMRQAGSGRPRIIQRGDERYLQRLAIRNRNENTGQVRSLLAMMQCGCSSSF
jgi:hypothetical protein